MSIGVQAGAEVGGGATYEDHKVTIGAQGEVKLLAGVELNASVTVNVAPVEDAAKKAAEETEKQAKALAESKAAEEAQRQARAAQEAADRQARAAAEEAQRQARAAEEAARNAAEQTKRAAEAAKAEADKQANSIGNAFKRAFRF